MQDLILDVILVFSKSADSAGMTGVQARMLMAMKKILFLKVIAV